MGWGGGGGHVNVPCTSYIIVCYAAKICGIVATLLVSTLLMGWGGVGYVNVPCTSYVIIATLQRSLGSLLLRYLLLRC